MANAPLALSASAIESQRAAFLEVLDQANMVVLQMAFWFLGWDRHHLRRRLGGSKLGPALGLGSQGNFRPGDVDGLSDHRAHAHVFQREGRCDGLAERRGIQRDAVQLRRREIISWSACTAMRE